MTKKLFFATTILLVLAFAAVAADLSGKWVAESPGRGGGPAVKTTFDLKADGTKLTGTVAGGMGRQGGEAPPPAEISNGKVDGNKVSFEVKRQGPNGEMVMKYEGTLSGDDLKLTQSFETPNGPRTRELVAKKSTT